MTGPARTRAFLHGKDHRAIASFRIEDALSLPMVYLARAQFCGDPFAGDAAAAHGVACFHGHGRGRYLAAPLAGFTLLASLRGGLHVESNDGMFNLRARQFVCLPTGSVCSVRSRPQARWVALRLSLVFLSEISKTRAFRSFPAPLFLPVTMPFSREMLRCGAELMRTRIDEDAPAVGEQLSSLLLAAVQAQSPCQEWMDRAYGRSERHRRRVVVRLLNARNRILNAPFMNHDLRTLAAAARYSPSHFLRSFRDVFGKTPHGLLTEARMAMARELIRGSDLAIGEVAANVGYESRHAFSRLFKRETGVTATDFRIAACTADQT